MVEVIWTLLQCTYMYSTSVAVSMIFIVTFLPMLTFYFSAKCQSHNFVFIEKQNDVTCIHTERFTWSNSRLQHIWLHSPFSCFSLTSQNIEDSWARWEKRRAQSPSPTVSVCLQCVIALPSLAATRLTSHFCPLFKVGKRRPRHQKHALVFRASRQRLGESLGNICVNLLVQSQMVVIQYLTFS